MNDFIEIMPFLIPILLIDTALAIAAVVHILKHPCYRFGSRMMWLVIVVIVLLFGPVIYFVFGKGEHE